MYEEKKITRQELWNAILDDFSSPENKKIQEMLIREAPNMEMMMIMSIS